MGQVTGSPGMSGADRDLCRERRQSDTWCLRPMATVISPMGWKEVGGTGVPAKRLPVSRVCQTLEGSCT